MTKFNKVFLIIIVLLAVGLLVLGYFYSNDKEDSNFNIVTTFYPVELIVDNLIFNVDDVKNVNISKSSDGCMHNYDFTPHNIRQFDDANLIIKNGQGMEEFLEDNKFQKYMILDSSSNIPNTDVSEHCWMDLDNYMSQIITINDKLVELDKKNENKYNENMDSYVSKVLALKEKFKEIKSDTNVGIMNDAFKYYANDGCFNITSEFCIAHDGNYTANDINTFLKKIKDTNTKVILVDSQTIKDNPSLINMINREIDIKVYILDLIVTPSRNLDQYIDSMDNNILVLKEAIEYGK